VKLSIKTNVTPTATFLSFKSFRTRIAIIIVLVTITCSFLYVSFEDPIISRLYYAKSQLFYKLSSTLQPHLKPKTLLIHIKLEDLQTMKATRERNLAYGYGAYSEEDWVAATIVVDTKQRAIDHDKVVPVKIRIKGTSPDHWDDSKAWSFRINVKPGRTLFGLQRLSLQRPRTREFLVEWLFMKFLAHEDLISHRIEFVTLALNGESLGIYTLQEQYSDQLLEYNKRREGPIVGFTKDLMYPFPSESHDGNHIEPVHNSNILTSLGQSVFWQDDYWNAPVDVSNTKKYSNMSDGNNTLSSAFAALNSFRNGTHSASTIFDIKALASLAAIRALLGSHEFDWRDIKFYYNPITKVLEPIGREIHSVYRHGPHIGWWMGNTITIDRDQLPFINNIFSDIEFMALYLQQLENISTPSYLDEFLKTTGIDFDSYNSLLSQETGHHFDLSILKTNQAYIRSWLNRVPKIHASLTNKTDPTAILISNLSPFPIEIHSIDVLEKRHVNFSPSIIPKKQLGSPVHPIVISINNEQFATLLSNSEVTPTVTYSLLGTNSTHTVNINPFNRYTFDPVFLPLHNFYKELPISHEFVSIDEQQKVISISKGSWTIDSDVVFPPGYIVVASSGTKLNLSNNASIVSYSPMTFLGTEPNPIIVTSENNDGGGLLVIQAPHPSLFQHVVFHQLSRPHIPGTGITGAITFFESPVTIKHSIFTKNRSGDDYLNIIKSEFLLRHLNFEDVFSDAVDSDFSDGQITDLHGANIGNDAIDISGGNVVASNIILDNIGDKGVSAGEASSVQISNLSVNNSYIALASKDNSQLVLENISISKSIYGLTAYRKKSQYGGGSIHLISAKLNNVEHSVVHDHYSRIASDVDLNIDQIDKLFEHLYQ